MPVPESGDVKKPVVKTTGFDHSEAVLGSLNVRGLLALRTLGHFELDLLAFFQGLETTHLNGGKVCEQIFAAIIGGNEAKTFSVVKPFYGTSCHLHTSLKNYGLKPKNMFEIQDRKRPNRYCRKLEAKHSRLFTSNMTASQALFACAANINADP